MAKKIRAEKDIRTNDILLGPLERPVLAFFARNMPKWVNSDMLTVLGLLGSVLSAVAYALVGLGEVKANPWLFVASLGFVINWFGDSLDGTLARYRNMSRPNYGYYTDHAIDGLTTLLVFVGIGLSGMARFDVTLIALSGWLLLMLQVYLKTHATGVFEMTSIKVGPTEMRLVIIALNTAVYFVGAGSSLFDVTIASQVIPVNLGTLVLGVFAILFVLYYIYQVITTGSKLAYEDGEALKRRQLEEKKSAHAERKLSKAEKKATKKSKDHAEKVPENSSGMTI